MSDDRELITIMHRGMTAQADRAPDAAALAERILATATATAPASPAIRRSRLHGWALPALAAATVAAVAAGVLVGNRILLPGQHRSPTSAASPSSHPADGPAGSAVPAGFRPVGTSFINPDQGWALGSVPCKPDRCTTMVRTRDGGATWTSVAVPPLAIPTNIMIDPVLSGCNTVVCVSGIRFATAQIGYVFNAWQLFMTVDGGSSWHSQGRGGAGLAIANGTVWVLAGTASGSCETKCPVRLQAAAVGSQVWGDVALPSVLAGTGADLARAGQLAALVVYGTSAQERVGKQQLLPDPSVLVISTDGGASWISHTEPCPQSGAGAQSVRPSVALDGSITLLCRALNTGDSDFTITSTDGGATFARSAPLGGTGDLVGAASSSVLLVATTTLLRSSDAGKSWQPVSVGGKTVLRVASVTFETSRFGHLLVQDENGLSPTIWSTTDAGASWSAHTFR